MIAYLRGLVAEALPTRVVLDVHGVGYEVFIPLSSFDRLPGIGQETQLLTHLVIREDAHTLYGFATAGERDLFRLLIDTVSGIGPKIALNVLSGMPAPAFRAAVTQGDVRALSQISGVGRKTAERIVVELKDRLGPAHGTESLPAVRPADPEGQLVNDATLALVALGFKQQEAADAVRGARAVLGAQASVEQLVRACLRKGAG